jgi:uncharacterized phage protein gp47/JayE
MTQADWLARRTNYLASMLPGLQTAYGSTAWKWSNAQAMGDNDVDQIVQQGALNASIANAVGPALDALGAGFNVYRQPAIYATVPVVFSLNPVNPSAATTISTGAVVLTPTIGGQGSVQFTTLADATIPANSANSNTVTAECLTTGTAGNVATGTVTIPYSGVPAGVTVSNPAAGGSSGYVAGAAAESDDSYRAAIFDAIQNQTAAARIEGVAKQQSGTWGAVFDAHLVDAADQHGNYTLYVCDVAGNSGSPLQTAVTNAVNGMGNIGLTPTIAGFTLTTTNITGTVTLLSGAVLATVVAGCQAAMNAWAAGLKSNSNLLLTDLIVACYGAKKNIAAVPGLGDLTITAPSAPVAIDATHIARLGTITLTLGSI